MTTDRAVQLLQAERKRKLSMAQISDVRQNELLEVAESLNIAITCMTQYGGEYENRSDRKSQTS